LGAGHTNNGNIYSANTYGANGNVVARIDFMGTPHNGMLPHVHTFSSFGEFINKGPVITLAQYIGGL